MNKRYAVLLVLLLVIMLILSFGAGAYYQAYRQVGFFVSPRQALERSSDVLVAAIRALRAANTAFAPTKIPPGRLDQSLVALHDVQTGESSTALYNFATYNRYRDIWSALRQPPAAPVVLEIGPGSNIAQGVIFVMTGTKKYYRARSLYRSGVSQPVFLRGRFFSTVDCGSALDHKQSRRRVSR